MGREQKAHGDGGRLRRERKRRQLTLAEAASQAGISTMRASEIERMQSIEPHAAVIAYAQALGFRVEVRSPRLVRCEA